MYTFLFNNDYLLNKKDETVEVQQQAKVSDSDSDANAQTVTIPINGTNTKLNLKAKLTDTGNVPVATATKDKTKGLELENSKAKYVHIDLNKLPKKNVFYNTLETYHKGFKKASTEQKSKIFADYLKHVNPEKREALIEKLHEGGQFKEVDEIMIKGNKELGENAVLTNRVALTKTKNGAIKKVTDGMVADHYTEAQAPYQTTILKDIYKYADKEAKIKAAGHTSDVNVKYQIAAHKLTALQGDEDVAAAGAKVSWKAAKENQLAIVKIYKKLNNEKVENTIATIEGKYNKDNQQQIYKILMSSKYKSVLKTAANNIYTMDKDNQYAAVKMTTDTHCQEAIDAAKSHYADYDTSCQKDITKVLNKDTDSKEKNSTDYANKATQQESKDNSKIAKTSDKTTIDEEFEKIKNSTSANKTQQMAELIKNANPVDQLSILKILPAEQAISIAKMISNPSEDIINLIATRSSELSQREQNMLVDTIGKQYSDKTLATIFPLCDENLQMAYLNTTNDTTIFSLVNKNSIASKVQEKLKEKNIFEL